MPLSDAANLLCRVEVHRPLLHGQRRCARNFVRAKPKPVIFVLLYCVNMRLRSLRLYQTAAHALSPFDVRGFFSPGFVLD